MTTLPSALPCPNPRSIDARISVRVLADRPLLARLGDVLADEDRLEVQTVSTPESSPSAGAGAGANASADVNADADPDGLDVRCEQLEDVECLVLAAAAVGTDGNVLDRLDRRAPGLPVVLVTDAAADDHPDSDVLDAVRSRRWIDHVLVGEECGPTATRNRLGRRIRDLVERRRLAALSSRSLASIELAQDPIALVGPDDGIEFANRWFAMQFDYDRATLPGISWQDLFTADAVDRLDATAIPTVADGWRWTGICTARRRSNETFPAAVRLGGLEDGSLVFVVEELGGDDADDTADGA